MALAVSAQGGMVAPKPSRAVVGKVYAASVEQRSLVVKDITSVTSTAPLDAVQARVAAPMARHDLVHKRIRT